MKVLKILCMALLCLNFMNTHAQDFNQKFTYDSAKWVKKNQFRKAVKAPVMLMAAGLLSITDNEILNDEEIAERVPRTFRVHADDYLQYAPILTMYGLKLGGVEGKNNFGNSTVMLIKSELLMMAMVSPTKVLTHRLRPDGSSCNSFPSGHTAQAFVAATILHKEYGHLSPWYSIGAYGAAVSVGLLRVMNNRHYMSDVLVGAGIGILCTNLVYLTHQYKWTSKKRNKSSNLVILPTYSNKSLGLQLSLKL